MKKIFVLFGICFLLTAGMILAEDEDGGYAGAYLQVPLSPRAAAMGSAYIGISNDGAGILYNPAGLTAVKKLDFSSAYRVMQLDRKLGYLSFVIPTRMESTIGFSWIYAGSGDVEGRSNAGQLTGRTVSSNDHGFGVSFAKQFIPAFGLGLRLNYYYKTFEDVNANTIGVNLGAMLSIDSLFDYGEMEEKPINEIKVGLIVENMAASYSWSRETSNLNTDIDNEIPVEVGFGLSFMSFHRTLLTAFDVRKNSKQSLEFRAGAEYKVHRSVDLRAGLNNGTLAAGVGFRIPIGKASLVNIDYAFSLDKADEGSEHIIGISVGF